MLLAMLTDEQRERVDFLFVRDYFNDKRWADAVRAGVSDLYGNARISLVGFKKDSSSYYLSHFPQWDFVDAGSGGAIDATNLRDVYFGGGKLDSKLTVLRPYVDAGVLDYLEAWAGLAEFGVRCAEHHAVKEYREKYPGPHYLTADCVVEADGHVLLIRRGGQMGYGQWALPGGFIDPGETFYSAALRELEEETGYRALPDVMLAALKGSAVFDHPGRSPRGRIITQAFHFQLNTKRLPQVQGADDAKEAVWVPVDQLKDIEADIFEDHASILDHFLRFMEGPKAY